MTGVQTCALPIFSEDVSDELSEDSSDELSEDVSDELSEDGSVGVSVFWSLALIFSMSALISSAVLGPSVILLILLFLSISTIYGNVPPVK